ncbi:MAG: hypothetical protein ABSH36_03080 [Solirubrobacteraceae bacterium]
MKYFKSLGLCLVAVFALGAVVASTASASTQTILFKEGGSKPAFSSIAGEGKLVTKFAEIKCKSARNSGEAKPGTDLLRKIRILFSGCKVKIKTEEIECNSKNQPAGSIQTFPLLAELGDIKSGTPLITGFVLTAEAGVSENPETLFAEFSCGPTIKVKVRGREVGGVKGGIIGELAENQVNTLLDKGTAALVSFKQKAGEPTVQAPNTLTVLNVEHKELLLESAITGGGGFELAGLEEVGHDELFFLESVEFSCKG